MNRLILEKNHLAQKNSPQLQLISNRVSPFGQRVWITLLEKNCAFQFQEVSLTNKSAYFTQTYRKAFGHDKKSTGKVPILIEEDKVLCESDMISWYISEKYNTGNQLIPIDSNQRLRMRYFMDSCFRIVRAYYSFKGWHSKSEEAKEKQLKHTKKALDKLEKYIVLPYACGNDFSLADIMIYPWIQRWPVIEKYFNFSIGKEYVKVHKWIENVQKRQSIKATRQSDEFYIKGYAPYFKE